jgi:hypothetical protein
MTVEAGNFSLTARKGLYSRRFSMKQRFIVVLAIMAMFLGLGLAAFAALAAQRT